jgi:hypothetical protein
LNPIAPGIDAAKSAVRDAVDFATIKTKVRAKNPNATEEQVDAGAKKVLTQRRQREREAEDRQASIDSKKRMEELDQTLQKMRADKEARNFQFNPAATQILLPYAWIQFSKSAH